MRALDNTLHGCQQSILPDSNSLERSARCRFYERVFVLVVKMCHTNLMVIYCR